MLHLRKLSSAGITHVHLLPTFQFAGVDDDKSKWQKVGTESLFIVLLSHFYSFSLRLNELLIIYMCVCVHCYADFEKLKSFPPDSDEQQACITAIQDKDGYNWG